MEEGVEPEAMGREHGFSTNCLNLLAGSMSAIAEQRPADRAIDQQIENLRQHAEAIRESGSSSLDHSNAVRGAAEASAGALGSMQKAFAGTDQQALTAVDSGERGCAADQPDRGAPRSAGRAENVLSRGGQRSAQHGDYRIRSGIAIAESPMYGALPSSPYSFDSRRARGSARERSEFHLRLEPHALTSTAFRAPAPIRTEQGARRGNVSGEQSRPR